MQERRAQQLRRLQEINAWRREEMLQQDQERLDKLLALQEMLEDGYMEQFHKNLVQLNMDSAEELQSYINKLSLVVGQGRQQLLQVIIGSSYNERSKEILDKNLLQSARDLRLGQRFTFQQDSDPTHTAKTTQKLIRDKCLNVLECPSQSSDLNPIEHLWRDLKIVVKQRSPSKLSELEKICREEWEKLPKYRCAKLVASYPRRLEAVIAAKGASTKY
uniref:Tc1-like transposase DDE domain-containing protein n=1 Tax=Oncorhynchus tshawytscha TaxID=74940 RepID=A0A8C8C490_ONCTS